MKKELKERLNLNGRIFDLNNLTNEKEFKQELRLFLFKVLSKELDNTQEIAQGVENGLDSKISDLDDLFKEYGVYIDYVKNEMLKNTNFSKQAIDLLYNELYKMNLENTIKSDLDFRDDSFYDDLAFYYIDEIVEIQGNNNNLDDLFMIDNDFIIGLYIDKNDNQHFITFKG